MCIEGTHDATDANCILWKACFEPNASLTAGILIQGNMFVEEGTGVFVDILQAGCRLSFAQGLDVRLCTEETHAILATFDANGLRNAGGPMSLDEIRFQVRTRTLDGREALIGENLSMDVSKLLPVEGSPYASDASTPEDSTADSDAIYETVLSRAESLLQEYLATENVDLLIDAIGKYRSIDENSFAVSLEQLGRFLPDLSRKIWAKPLATA